MVVVVPFLIVYAYIFNILYARGRDQVVTTKRAWVAPPLRPDVVARLHLRARSDEMQALREQVFVAPRYVSQSPSPRPIRSSPPRAPRAPRTNVPQSRVLSTLVALNMSPSTAEPRPYVHQCLSTPTRQSLTAESVSQGTPVSLSSYSYL